MNGRTGEPLSIHLSGLTRRVTRAPIFLAHSSVADTDVLPDLETLASQATFEDLPSPDDAPTRTRKPRADKGQPRGPRGGPRATTRSKLATDLLDPLAKFAQVFTFVAPTVSAVIISRGEKVTTALVEIAKDHPRMMAALQRASQIGPASDLIEFAAMIFIAGAMDFGRIPPEHPLGVITGVSHFYHMTHQMPDTQTTSGESPNGAGFVMTPPPPLMNDPRHPVYSFQAGR